MRNNFINAQGYQNRQRQQTQQLTRQGMQNIARQASAGQAAMRQSANAYQPEVQNHLSGMSEAVDLLTANLQRQQAQEQRQAEQAARRAQLEQQQALAAQKRQQALLVRQQQAAQTAARVQQSQPLILQQASKNNTASMQTGSFRMGGGSYGGGAGRYDAKRQSTGITQMGGGSFSSGGAGRCGAKQQSTKFTPGSSLLQRTDQALTELRQMQDAAEKNWLPAMEKRADEIPIEDEVRFWKIVNAEQGRDRDENSKIPGLMERELKDRGYDDKSIAELKEYYKRKSNEILTGNAIQKREELAKKHPWVASVVSVADNFFGEMQQPMDDGLQLLGQRISGIYAPTDTNRPAQRSVKMADAARQTVREGIENHEYVSPKQESAIVNALGGADKVNHAIGRVGGMLYTGGMNMADYGVKSAIYGPFANQANALFSAGRSFTNAQDRGTSVNDSLDYAAAAAAIDLLNGGLQNAALEKLNPNGGAGNILGKIGIRGLGSTAGQTAKETADLRITGENSWLAQVGQQAYSEAVRTGASETQAQEAARQAMQKQLGSDALYAFGSGAITAGMDELAYGAADRALRAWQGLRTPSGQNSGEVLAPQSQNSLMEPSADGALPRWPVLPVRGGRQALDFAPSPEERKSDDETTPYGRSKAEGITRGEPTGAADQSVMKYSAEGYMIDQTATEQLIEAYGAETAHQVLSAKMKTLLQDNAFLARVAKKNPLTYAMLKYANEDSLQTFAGRAAKRAIWLAEKNADDIPLEQVVVNALKPSEDPVAENALYRFSESSIKPKNFEDLISMPLPDDIDEQFYRKIILGDSKELPIDRERNITVQRLETYYTPVYLAKGTTIKPKTMHDIYRTVDAAREKWQIDEMPTIVVVSENELPNAHGKYDAINNVIYLNRHIRMEECVADAGGLDAVEYHEMWHMHQAEQFRKAGWTITEKNRGEYLKALCEKCKKNIDKLGITVYNVNEISEYAQKCYMDGRYDEVEAEYYTQQYIRSKKKKMNLAEKS